MAGDAPYFHELYDPHFTQYPQNPRVFLANDTWILWILREVWVVQLVEVWSIASHEQKPPHGSSRA
jgi:hypothetical protein